MHTLFCVDWTEDDEACGAKEAGFSLHLTREDAEAFVRANASPAFGQEAPRAVAVPEEVYEAVRRTACGLYAASPRECPYLPAEGAGEPGVPVRPERP